MGSSSAALSLTAHLSKVRCQAKEVYRETALSKIRLLRTVWWPRSKFRLVGKASTSMTSCSGCPPTHEAWYLKGESVHSHFCGTNPGSLSYTQVTKIRTFRCLLTGEYIAEFLFCLSSDPSNRYPVAQDECPQHGRAF
jgi:hypothetical protein